jgi:hypothetical protein
MLLFLIPAPRRWAQDENPWVGGMTVLAIRTEQMPVCRRVARASRPCVSWASCPRFEDTHAHHTKRQGQDALATRPRNNGQAPPRARRLDGVWRRL